MTKVRVIFLILGLSIVGILGFWGINYARGYRLDLKTLKFNPRGILVIKTTPSGAQIFINGALKGASDSNLSLAPGTYDVEIKKEGFTPWRKRLTIEKETVTQAEISLFKSVPALSPVTSEGAVNPVISTDFSRIVFGNENGLYLIETLNFPLGFNREPKKITDGNLANASWEFSPRGNEILLATGKGVYLLDPGAFTPQAKRVNIAGKETEIKKRWTKEHADQIASASKNLPKEVKDIITRKSSRVTFSPDETKVLYTASASASLPPNLIKPLPGASTQKENRDIKIDHTYVYDIKEDRNFLIDDGSLGWNQRNLFWLHNSQNLVLAEDAKVTILEYDNTNRQVVFSGNYISPNVFPYINASKLLILTNLGATASPNLYAISIK